MPREQHVTFETPRALQPVAGMVNARIALIGDKYGADPSREKPTATQKDVSAKLKRIGSYDGVQVTAKQAGGILETVHVQDRLVDELVADLEIVDLLEKGGLDAVSAKLNEELGILKSNISSKIKDKAATRFDRLLHRAIYIFPHLATGVEVTLTDEAANNPLPEDVTYVGDFRENRVLLSHLQEETGSSTKTFAVPLPYEYIGIRDGIRSDKVQIVARSGDYSPKLKVELGQGERSTYFHFDEVESIKFITNQNPKFIPNVDRRGKEERVDRPDPVTAYLEFRGFEKLTINYDWKKLGEVTDDEFEAVRRRLLVPKYNRKLWEDSKMFIIPDKLKKGFMVLTGERPEDTQLIEIENKFLPRADFADTQTRQAKLLITMLRKGPDAINAKVYKGNEIIRRLAAIPAEEIYY